MIKYKGKAKIIIEEDNKSVVKSKKKDLNELYEYLSLKGFECFPKIIEEDEDNVRYEYIDNVYTTEDEKGKQERQNRSFVYFFASSCFLLVWIIVINFVISDAFYRLLFRSFIDVMPAFIQKLSQIYFFEILFFIIKAVFYFALPPAAAGKVAQLAYLFVRRRRKRLFQQNENHVNDLH